MSLKLNIHAIRKDTKEFSTVSTIKLLDLTTPGLL